MTTNHVRVRPAVLTTVAACLIGLSGCSTVMFAWDDAAIRVRDECQARKAWHENRSVYEDVEHRWSFRNGFKAGYASVAAGGDGGPPCLPPRHYWWKRFQRPRGRAQIRAWYDGFAHGAVAAQYDGVSIRDQLGCVAGCHPHEPCTWCDNCGGQDIVPGDGDVFFPEEITPVPSVPPAPEAAPPAAPPAEEEDQWRPTQQPAPLPIEPDRPYVEPETIEPAPSEPQIIEPAPSEPETFEEPDSANDAQLRRPLSVPASYRAARSAFPATTRTPFGQTEWLLPIQARCR